MTILEIIKHIEINENYQGINLTEFSFDADDFVSNDQIVNTFLKSKSFSYDSLPDCVKREPKKGYLRRAFYMEHIEINDFKKCNNEGLIKFLVDFLNEPNWGDDRINFERLLNKYFEIHNPYEKNDFYIISKDWFEEENKKLTEPENLIYIFYFLIISVDRKSKRLTLTEWTYD
ncbi:hypothetical protein [Flavobacterium sp. CSZ]|uniref:hypothetical protein n=1 Tax=Flavobacterium sp. CSZ TaxID=2783791 RepID=UPI00188AF272|nr:hypothetical protein [Flavobacterium sp. CSZ]MBF4487419.1 hypothetical protein [Flavobacterium sp. CSZ]